MSSSLVEAFNVIEKNNTFENINDYETFKDKVLLDELRNKIIEDLIDKDIPTNVVYEDFINNQIDKSIEGYDLSNQERSHLFNLINDEVNGYGPLTELLKDNNITEIMVNGPSEIYIEIDGEIVKDDSVSFINEEHIIRTIKRLIEPVGRTIDTRNPMVDSRLQDGSRINAIIPPLSTKGPIITIRKFKVEMTDIEELIRIGSLTPYMARFLEASVKAKLNILVSGGTGSGKTNLLNVLSSFIPDEERIITIEEAAELKLNKSHIISLETRNDSYDGDNDVNVRDLVINALHMRPDRLIVGEVRGKEAFDVLQAMNTGHDGSMTTIHANSSVDALNRLETLVLMTGMEIPMKALREYINNAIDLVVHIERMSDGKRKITRISEVTEIVKDKIILKDIFAFTQNGLTNSGEVNGEFILYDYVPNVLNKFKAKGIDDVFDMFNVTKESVLDSIVIPKEEKKPKNKFLVDDEDLPKLN